jgi:hypothetical protein
MKPRQIPVYKDLEKVTEKKVIPVTLKVEVEKYVTVNICNAAEKIADYPEPIQKLVWRALHYKCEIGTRRSMSLSSLKHCEKITKYIEAFRQTQKLIFKMCRRQKLIGIIIEGGF